jgi:hypothetical protein
MLRVYFLKLESGDVFVFRQSVNMSMDKKIVLLDSAHQIGLFTAQIES